MLLTLTYFKPLFSVSFFGFEQADVCLVFSEFHFSSSCGSSTQNMKNLKRLIIKDYCYPTEVLNRRVSVALQYFIFLANTVIFSKILS